MAVSKTQGITAASLIAAVGIVTGANTALDAKYQPVGEYVLSAEFQKMNSRVLIGQWWDRLDDYREARQHGDVQRERDIEQELIEVLAEICEIKPTFRYCETGIPRNEL